MGSAFSFFSNYAYNANAFGHQMSCESFLTHLFRQPLQRSASITVLHLLELIILSHWLSGAAYLCLPLRHCHSCLTIHSFCSQLIIWSIRSTMFHIIILYLFFSSTLRSRFMGNAFLLSFILFVGFTCMKLILPNMFL